jgi:threonine dehydratase
VHQPPIEDRLVSLERIRLARERIAGRVHRTPMLTSATAARVIEASTGVAIADGRLHLKAEHLQKTGSFKPRATTSKLAALTPVERAAGIVTVSAGNAAQAYAWAGRDQGVLTTVVMPIAAAPNRVAACRGYGAEVILAGVHVGETFAEMERLRSERGLVLCHPFDDPDVIAGDASVGLELLDDLPEVDVVVVAIGGGGLISGIATAVKELRPSVRVYGVEPVGSDAMRRAIEAGQPVRIEPSSIADSLGAPYAGHWTLPICQRYLDDIVLLTDPEILSGVRFAAERVKQVVEPAGGAALAALLLGRIPLRPGDRVATVLCGGNVDVAGVSELVAAASPLPGLGA